jgi:serine/threonine-protein kinase HipA
VPVPPVAEFDLAGLQTIALQMAGKMSISGVQRKVSIRISSDGARIEPANEKGRYILKPQGTYLNIPENEHLTMRMAGLAGLEIPPCGLIRLTDGTYAYIIKRFNRTDTGEKLRQEDFC